MKLEVLKKTLESEELEKFKNKFIKTKLKKD